VLIVLPIIFTWPSRTVEESDAAMRARWQLYSPKHPPPKVKEQGTVAAGASAEGAEAGAGAETAAAVAAWERYPGATAAGKAGVAAVEAGASTRPLLTST